MVSAESTTLLMLAPDENLIPDPVEFCSTTVVPLVDLHRATVGIFDDEAATPRADLVILEDWCAQLVERGPRRIERADV